MNLLNEMCINFEHLHFFNFISKMKAWIYLLAPDYLVSHNTKILVLALLPTWPHHRKLTQQARALVIV